MAETKDADGGAKSTSGASTDVGFGRPFAPKRISFSIFSIYVALDLSADGKVPVLEF